MTLNQFRSALYTVARITGDVNAVKRGRAPQRVANVLIGRSANRLLRRLWR